MSTNIVNVNHRLHLILDHNLNDYIYNIVFKSSKLVLGVGWITGDHCK